MCRRIENTEKNASFSNETAKTATSNDNYLWCYQYCRWCGSINSGHLEQTTTVHKQQRTSSKQRNKTSFLSCVFCCCCETILVLTGKKKWPSMFNNLDIGGQRWNINLLCMSVFIRSSVVRSANTISQSLFRNNTQAIWNTRNRTQVTGFGFRDATSTNRPAASA